MLLYDAIRRKTVEQHKTTVTKSIKKDQLS